MKERIDALLKELQRLKAIGFDQWCEGVDNNNKYSEICCEIDDLLVTPEGEPAMRNIEFFASEGFPTVIERIDDEFWYGQLFVEKPYHITFKYRGQDAIGV